jgi:hypothetical protein
MKNIFRTRTSRFVLAGIGVCLLYLVGVVLRQQYGIGIVVSNESGETLRQVCVKVESLGDRGKRHNLGALAPGDRVHVYVQPVTESHINLEFMDARNNLHVETAVGYAEAGYCGNAKATILPGGITRISKVIAPIFCKRSWFDFFSAKNSTPWSSLMT